MKKLSYLLFIIACSLIIVYPIMMTQAMHNKEYLACVIGVLNWIVFFHYVLIRMKTILDDIKNDLQKEPLFEINKI